MDTLPHIDLVDLGEEIRFAHVGALRQQLRQRVRDEREALARRFGTAGDVRPR